MPLDDLEIIGGNDVLNQLKPRDLDVLVDLWVEETFEPVDLPVSQTRASVGEVLDDHEKFQIALKARSKADLRQHLEDVLAQGNMVIAKKDGRVIGMVRVMKLDRDGDIFEIGKGLVVPEERGKGVYAKVREHAIAQLRAKYGDVSILAGTKTEATKRLNRNDGWQEIGFAEYLRIHGAPDDYIESQKDDIKNKGWTAFLYVPGSSS